MDTSAAVQSAPTGWPPAAASSLSGKHLPREVAERISLRGAGATWRDSWAAGKALRAQVPRASHAEWVPPADRADPVGHIEQSNRGRIDALVPLRVARMAASPFAFLRGAAAVMAPDLAATPTTGVHVVIDGDAHAANFGLYGTPQRDVVFDLNDFDETTIGPWEWDIKRLAVSIDVIGRDNGTERAERGAAVARMVQAYRTNMAALAERPVLDVWHLHSYADLDRIEPLIELDEQSRAVLDKAVERARQRTHAQLLTKAAEPTEGGSWRFKHDPPILARVDDATREQVIDALEAYTATIATDWQFMVRRYRVVDVAHRVVGVGSVGTRSYLALLLGHSHDDPLFLQVKEAIRCSYASWLPALPEDFTHDGRRIVHGQRLMQASTDMLLGWTSVGERHFYVRQMKNMKGSIPVESLRGAPYAVYAWVTGLLLARAHARTGDAAMIAGYCGRSDALDRAIVAWADAYGDQNARDHAALVAAVDSGRLQGMQDRPAPD